MRDQVDEYEASGGTRANTLRDTGIPVIIVTMRGASSGKVRKIALMRVEHEGEYTLVALDGRCAAAPAAGTATCSRTPVEVMIQDGPEPFDVTVREVHGRRACHLVGAVGGGVPALRRVPGEDRAGDPGAGGRRT